MAQNDPSHLLQILKGCCDKDRSSQNELYRLYYPYGMSVCSRYVKGKSQATVVLNEGFFKLFKNIKKFDKDRPFKPWFRRILVNTCINHIKKNKKFLNETNMEAARNISTSEEVLSRIGYQELMAMVQSLSSAYRTVFNMYVIDGFKHREIAVKLGISEGTSKSNLTRARANLRKLITKKLNSPYV